MMTAGLRRFIFTTHVTSSLGWVGAVIVFLVLTITARDRTSTEPPRGPDPSCHGGDQKNHQLDPAYSAERAGHGGLREQDAKRDSNPDD